MNVDKWTVFYHSSAQLKFTCCQTVVIECLCDRFFTNWFLNKMYNLCSVATSDHFCKIFSFEPEEVFPYQQGYWHPLYPFL